MNSIELSVDLGRTKKTWVRGAEGCVGLGSESGQERRGCRGMWADVERCVGWGGERAVATAAGRRLVDTGPAAAAAPARQRAAAAAETPEFCPGPGRSGGLGARINTASPVRLRLRGPGTTQSAGRRPLPAGGDG